MKTGGAFCALKMPIDVCSHELPLISAFPVLDHDMNRFHSRYNGFSANKVFNLRDGHLKSLFSLLVMFSSCLDAFTLLKFEKKFFSKKSL